MLNDHPVNIFVARFLGTANVLEGRAETHGETVLFKTNHGETLTLTGALANSSARVIVLRPQNIEISDTAGPDTLPGKVLHREFLGSAIRYIVQAAGTEIVVDESHVSGQVCYRTDETLLLRVNPQTAVLLKD